MDLDELAALSVPGLATPDAVIFMWATAPKLVEALQLMEAWSFGYVTHMIWDKEKIGMGYYARGQHELLLIGKRGTPPVPSPSDRPSSVVRHPRGAHSAKPDVFYEIIERMYPGLPRLELFARTQREGWASWGNQSK
jgi:N6-adenosine-specific RNA methylase IME4